MSKKLDYLNIYQEISSISKELLDKKGGAKPDLFSESTSDNFLSFLNSTSLLSHIQPISLLSSQKIKIYPIEKIPKKIFYYKMNSYYGNLFIACTEI